MKRGPSIAALRRDHPEWFSGSYFSAPVRAWKSMKFVPSEWSSANFKLSQAMTATREAGMRSNDVQRKWVAQGSIGVLSKRPAR